MNTDDYDAGYEAGKADGYVAGFAEGHGTGKEVGYEQGYNNGYRLGKIYMLGLIHKVGQDHLWKNCPELNQPWHKPYDDLMETIS